jgi:Fe-S cluster assembly iron-binding protein IscA
LGLALDESENANDAIIQNNGIAVLLDKEIEALLRRGKPVTIDFHTSKYGSGFIIDTGSSC